MLSVKSFLRRANIPRDGEVHFFEEDGKLWFGYRETALGGTVNMNPLV